MGIEGTLINRRKFLQTLGAAALTAIAPTVLLEDAEAARNKKKNVEAPERIRQLHTFEQIRYPILDKFQFSEKGYDRVRRIKRGDFKALVPKGLQVKPQQNRFTGGPHVLGVISGANLLGSPEERRAGRVERALRFKNISDAVELRYNLPAGIILAMVMQESYGADMNPNALNDGGIGLAHMQPETAQDFGLETHGGNSKMRDKRHGRVLRQRIADTKGDVFVLAAQDDDRFNRVLNLDAVGRMLATHMNGKLISSYGPLRTAILRYAGRHNFIRYWNNLQKRMTELHSPNYLAAVAVAFDARNKNLRANGVGATASNPPFALYLQTFWKENEQGFDLVKYRKLPAYEPTNSQDVLRTYRKALLSR